MTLDTSAQVLLLIVSVCLSALLIVLIIAVIKIVQLVHSVQRIVDKAGKVADSAESVGAFFASAAGPVSVARLLNNIVDSVVQHKKGKK